MFSTHGYWLPASETRVDEIVRDSYRLGRPAYQHTKLEAALKYCPRRGMAVDVGAHIGMWTLQFMHHGFEEVIAFEPEQEKNDCFVANLEAHARDASTAVTLHPVGLSDQVGSAAMVEKFGTTLKTHVKVGGGSIPLRTLDSYKLTPDLIKIDVEGFEVFVVRGAEKTIKRARPVIVVEQKKGVAAKRYGVGDQDALRLLESWGYHIAEEFNGDFIMVHDEPRLI